MWLTRRRRWWTRTWSPLRHLRWKERRSVSVKGEKMSLLIVLALLVLMGEETLARRVRSTLLRQSVRRTHLSEEADTTRVKLIHHAQPMLRHRTHPTRLNEVETTAHGKPTWRARSTLRLRNLRTRPLWRKRKLRLNSSSFAHTPALSDPRALRAHPVLHGPSLQVSHGRSHRLRRV